LECGCGVQDSLLEHAETTHKNKFLARFNLRTRMTC
jgi:hypothetical protein